ncbi:nitrogen fixation protein NifZ [Vibrio cincinnatiensis]|uniref:nitrogen fixation protein NifZ n=1 Tax=Vibrio cincinnatiensis TaxID=675 RepID=UPI001EDF8465|nr:nitrogen fixation protein NifZ [Vibrio cincinnatiensis]MCG3724274.1 nitrogen fixation protein NifZ [Vibrio cincinnatiensis]
MLINRPRFEPGYKVRVIRNIRNDGSFQDRDKGELLVTSGSIGIVRSYGDFLQSQRIYQVFIEAENKVVGVRESEVIDAALPWVPCLFRSQDKAKLTCSLTMFGKPLASKGDVIDVHRAYRNLDDGSVNYDVKFGEHIIRLEASRLTPVEA